MKTKIQDMTSGSPGRLIILFAIPLMLGNICQQLYTMVDTMVVGQIAGVEALAALGAVDFLMWVVTGISTGLTQGFSIQLSQYYGAKDFENLRKSLAHSYRLTAFIAVGVFILSQSFAALVLTGLHTPSNIIWYKRCLRRYFLLEDWNYWHRSSVLKYKSQAPGTFHTELWKLFSTIRYL